MKVWSICAEDATSYRSFVCLAVVTSLMPPSLLWDSTVPDSSEKNTHTCLTILNKDIKSLLCCPQNLLLRQCDYYHFQKLTRILIGIGIHGVVMVQWITHMPLV